MAVGEPTARSGGDVGTAGGSVGRRTMARSQPLVSSLLDALRRHFAPAEVERVEPAHGPRVGPVGAVSSEGSGPVGEGLAGRASAGSIAPGGPVDTVVDWDRLDAAQLRTAAKELQRGIAALEHQQRRVLRLVDQRRAFAVDGSRDAADWSANNLGISRRKANDQLGLGASLEGMPGLERAAAIGELSAEQARPAAQLAEAAGTDHGWAAQAPSLPVGVLARHAARRERPSAADHRAARSARHFRTWTDGHELRFRGSLPSDDGARLLAAVERAMPARDPHAPVSSTPDQRRADGLVALAGATLAGDADPDRATVAVVVELAAICDDDPAATAELEAGQPLATDAARRLLCDGRVNVIVQDPTGVAVGVGTTQRVVTPAMRRALMRRDGQCRFGGCTASGFLHAHHIDHWPAPTTLGNLVLLCWNHHHAVHEGGWTLSGDPNHALHATSPTGTPTVTSHPLLSRGSLPGDRVSGDPVATGPPPRSVRRDERPAAGDPGASGPAFFRLGGASSDEGRSATNEPSGPVHPPGVCASAGERVSPTDVPELQFDSG